MVGFARRTRQALRLAFFCLSALACGVAADGSARAQTVEQVPFVGCRSDGQTGAAEVPRTTKAKVRVEKKFAGRLAYYQAALGPGVFAPRGWHCFGLDGSNGEILIVAPGPLDRALLFSESAGVTGPAIQIHRSVGDTSGRFTVARIAARVFPAEHAFVRGVIDENLVPAEEFPFGPYPDDKLTYVSDRVVKYRTPPHKKGLGTETRLLPGDAPIDGAALFDASAPGLTMLAVRLPDGMRDLAAVIVQQAVDAYRPRNTGPRR